MMIKDGDKDINTNPELIKHYDLLNSIGIFSLIDDLKNEIRDLDELLEEGLKLFNKTTIEDLANYLTTRMLDKFVPSYLAFIFQDDFNPKTANILCYNNLQSIESPIAISSLLPYKNFFALSPSTVTFEAFEYMIDNKNLTDIFLPLDPEIIVPMMGLDGLYGFIVLGKKVINQKYSLQELQYIDKIMKFASLSLQNNINYRRAIFDSKTRLYKHSFFINKLNDELARLKRYTTCVSILMIDIDHFKKLNDTHGHLAGDKVIMEISKILSANVRQQDAAARFGGEEFIIMLVETRIEQAWLVAERIRKIIEKTETTYLDKELKVTVSIGVSYATKDEYSNSKELIEKADCALYNSKNNGRNKTTLYYAGMEELDN